MIIAHCPHKVIIAGSFVVLDGDPGIAVAIEPRIRLELDTRAARPAELPPDVRQAGPDDPYVRAVFDAFGLAAAEAARLDVRTTRPLDIDGWGVGSSAAFATALTSATACRLGLPTDPASVFALARRAHRAAQGGAGSGLDVAACCFGGAVVVRGAAGDATPEVAPAVWEDSVGMLLVKSGIKADTRARIAQWRELPAARAQAERDALVEGLDGLARAVVLRGPILPRLAEVAALETAWARALGLPFESELLAVLGAALQPMAGEGVLVKELGAGAGDSVGVFFPTRSLGEEEIRAQLAKKKVPVPAASIRAVPSSSGGVRAEGYIGW